MFCFFFSFFVFLNLNLNFFALVKDNVNWTEFERFWTDIDNHLDHLVSVLGWREAVKYSVFVDSALG